MLAIITSPPFLHRYSLKIPYIIRCNFYLQTPRHSCTKHPQVSPRSFSSCANAAFLQMSCLMFKNIPYCQLIRICPLVLMMRRSSVSCGIFQPTRNLRVNQLPELQDALTITLTFQIPQFLFYEPGILCLSVLSTVAGQGTC